MVTQEDPVSSVIIIYQSLAGDQIAQNNAFGRKTMNEKSIFMLEKSVWAIRGAVLF